jgi:hypothetical protein
MSIDRGRQPPSLTEAELKTLLVEALDDAPGWKSQETFHARFDHLERGISIDDVIFGIRSGWSFERPPEFNSSAWQWKYRIATQTIDEEPLTLIIAVDTADRTFEVVTRWKK